MASGDQSRLAALSAAAGRLHADHVTVEAARALREQGIDCVLLKGASVARWLFVPQDARSYSDSDLLVAPDRFQAAVGTLARLGFRAELDEAKMPPWWRAHALTLIRRIDHSVIDLHHNLPGVGVSDSACWQLLSSATEPLAVGGRTVDALTEPGRLVHCVLHAAQHGGAERDLDVLERALGQAGEDIWHDAARLASDLQAVASFRLGLALLPAGASLSERLGLAPGRTVEAELRAIAVPEALTLAQLVGTPGLGARLSVIRHKLAPPRTFMLSWSPLARRGRVGLAAAYAWRPLWVLTRLPRALRAWSGARNRAAR